MPNEQEEQPTPATIVRKDKYNIQIDGRTVRAGVEQEAEIRRMTPEQLTRFQKIMGLR